MLKKNVLGRPLRTGESKSLGAEKRSNALTGEFRQRSLNDFHIAQLLLGGFVRTAADLIEDVDREPRFGPVLERNGMHRPDGIFLATPREQVLGRLVQVEQEEPAAEH